MRLRHCVFPTDLDGWLQDVGKEVAAFIFCPAHLTARDDGPVLADDPIHRGVVVFANAFPDVVPCEVESIDRRVEAADSGVGVSVVDPELHPRAGGPSACSALRPGR